MERPRNRRTQKALVGGLAVGTLLVAVLHDSAALGASAASDGDVVYQLRLPASIVADADVEPVQLQSPARGVVAGIGAGMAPRLATAPQRGTTRTRQTMARTGAVVGLASVPYMIGDTGAGSCIGFTGLLTAEMSHPTLACGRLNIAEANTPLPVDRVYYSYRHFHNASTVSAYQFRQTFDYDRHLLAGEKTVLGGDGVDRGPVAARTPGDVQHHFVLA